jgi:hypothetical protein
LYILLSTPYNNQHILGALFDTKILFLGFLGFGDDDVLVVWARHQGPQSGQAAEQVRSYNSISMMTHEKEPSDQSNSSEKPEAW